MEATFIAAESQYEKTDEMTEMQYRFLYRVASPRLWPMTHTRMMNEDGGRDARVKPDELNL